MPFRKTEFAPGEHYHLCVRGNNKQSIFRSNTDRARLLFLMTHLQSPQNVKNISRSVAAYTQTKSWNIDETTHTEILKNRYVSLEAFAFMTNHIHLAVCEREEGGIVRYMQRILNAYAKYFNTKYEMIGHLFQGPYRSVHVEDNEQLLFLSSYIHRNPRELPGLAGKEHNYEWSSFQDYLGENRFGELLDCSLVFDQFRSTREYQDFVDSSIAKDPAYLFDPF